MPKQPDIPQGQEAYLRIVAEIRAGTLRPGERLTETDLARRFGISRTPIREAIRQLEADGLVSHVPRVGAAIRSLDHAEISELYEMRTVLEGTAARFAARAASDVELADLDAIHAGFATAGADARYHLNRQFHSALLDAARNRFLVRAVAAVYKTLLILGPSTLAQDERAAEAVEEHGSVLAALKARDPGAAEIAMRKHIEAGHRARLQHLRGRTTPDP